MNYRKLILFFTLCFILAVAGYGLTLYPNQTESPKNDNRMLTSKNKTENVSSDGVRSQPTQYKREQSWKKEANNRYTNKQIGVSLTLTDEWHNEQLSEPYPPDIGDFFNEPISNARQLSDQHGVYLSIEFNSRCKTHYINYYFTEPPFDDKDSYCANQPKVKDLLIDNKKAVLLSSGSENGLDGPAFVKVYLIKDGEDILKITFFGKTKLAIEQDFSSILSSIRFR